MDSSVFKAFLEEEGFRPRIDEDGDLVFKYEGSHFLLCTQKNDPTYVSLVYPNFWPIETAEERAKALVAINNANKHMKVAKIYILRDNVTASVEMFLEDAEAIQPVLSRLLRALKAIAHHFANFMSDKDDEEES